MKTLRLVLTLAISLIAISSCNKWSKSFSRVTVVVNADAEIVIEFLNEASEVIGIIETAARGEYATSLNPVIEFKEIIKVNISSSYGGASAEITLHPSYHNNPNFTVDNLRIGTCSVGSHEIRIKEKPTITRKSSTPSSNNNPSSTNCPSGKTFLSGPRGGCYYINSNGNKTYVDRSCC